MHKVIEIFSKNDKISLDIISTLILHKANPNLMNKNRKTPLQIAIEDKKKEAIKGIMKIY